MKRHGFGMLALVFLCAVSAPTAALAGTYFGFQIGLGGAPAAPRVVFVSAPRVDFVPEAGVYVVHDAYPGCDVFRDGAFWYMSTGNFWYRANSFRGPFVAIDVRMVPNRIFYVPATRWHHYPEALVRWHRLPARDRDHDRGHDRDDRDHGRDRG